MFGELAGRKRKKVKRAATQAMPLSTTKGQAVAAMPISIPEIPTVSTEALKTIVERDTQPLWHRLQLSAGQVPGNSRIQLFHLQKNQYPHLTNLEVGGQMPETGEFLIAGIEIRVLPTCDPAALAAFIRSCRLVAKQGAKGFEKVNQPVVMFPGLAKVNAEAAAGPEFSTAVPGGLYVFNPGEEILLAKSQTFDFAFEVDPTGFTIAADKTLDMVVVLKGQKRSSLPL